MLLNTFFLQDAATAFGLPCWLLWALCSLGSFLLGLLLGWWLWAHYRRRNLELEAELTALKGRFGDLERDYASLKYQLDESNKLNASLNTSLHQCDADKAVLSTKLAKLQEEVGHALGATGRGLDSGGAVDYGVLLGQENLQVVEGIGPKIEEVLKAKNIGTWSALAACSTDDLKEILEAAGPNYRIHDPASWPKQALLAAENHWDELIALQKSLDAGKSSETGDETPSKVEKMIAKIMGFSTNSADLKIVEGIGPKVEQLLKAAGINTWSDLAGASTERLQQILDAAGDNFRLMDPGTWAKQAELAAAGKWGELSEYQEFLDGGKEPTA